MNKIHPIFLKYIPVLDPFAGSGSTGVACEQLNRRYILIEKEAKYCEIIKRRISDYTKQLKLF